MRDNIKSSVPLFFSNEPLLSKIYVFWALFAAFLFGFLGTGRLVLNFVQKVNLYGEMRQINYDMNVRLLKLAELSEDLEKARGFVPLLESTIPADLNAHGYMVAFMQEASLAGFSVKNFVVAPETIGEDLPITAVLEGNGDLTSFVSGLESFQRVTVVDSVTLKTLSDTNEVTVNLRIFNL